MKVFTGVTSTEPVTEAPEDSEAPTADSTKESRKRKRDQDDAGEFLCAPTIMYFNIIALHSRICFQIIRF